MYCKLCGAENADNAELCPSCGADLQENYGDLILSESAHLLPVFDEGPPIQIKDRGKVFGIIGFGLGACALLTPFISSCIFCGCGATMLAFLGPLGSIIAGILPIVLVIFSSVASITGIVFSAIGKKRSKKCGFNNKFASAGIVFSIIALVLSVIAIILTIIMALFPTVATIILGIIAAIIGIIAQIVSSS